jgi:hypothetical protein
VWSEAGAEQCAHDDADRRERCSEEAAPRPEEPCQEGEPEHDQVDPRQAPQASWTASPPGAIIEP